MTEHLTEHIPVLLHETIDGLCLEEGDIVVDGTINTGGHSFYIAQKIGTEGTLIGIDRDTDALAIAHDRLNEVEPRVILIAGNYRDMDVLLEKEGVGAVDAIMLDIGLSNRQLFDSGRGFTFGKDEPLLMTFNPEPKEDELTAAEIVNEWEEGHIADVIRGYGGEMFAGRIARGIVAAREKAPIARTKELAQIIEESVPGWYRSKRIHPATKTFQALRVTVNDELGSLRDGIEKSIKLLKTGGRCAIITFHSGEDRIVKNMFRDHAQKGEVALITKKPIGPSKEEEKENPKARSAKLRIIEKK